MQRFYQLIRLTGSSCIAALLLLGCASQPSQTPTISTEKPTKVRQLIELSQLEAQAEPDRSNNALFNAALAADQSRAELAQASLLLVDMAQLNPTEQLQALNVAQQLIKQLASTETLYAWYSGATVVTPTTETAAMRLRFEASVALQQRRFQQALGHSLALSNSAFSTASDNQQLWQLLSQTTQQAANQLSAVFPRNSIAQGWIELGLCFLSNGDTLQRQAAMIDDWLQKWPKHPAARAFPAPLNDIQLRAMQPLTTAVVAIPLSGNLSNAGLAIQNAIIAAHLKQPQFSQLHFIDSNLYGQAEALYDQITQLNADVLIGPLDKSKAESISRLPTRTIPMVSLNAVSAQTSGASIHQLDLNIEDEARRLAELNQAEHSLPLLIIGSSALATRAAQAYEAKWHPETNTSIVKLYLSDTASYSKELSDALLISAAKERQTRLENIFIERMESTPRRRTDVSHIFMALTPTEARALKPLLNYHFAGDLPVYSPSIVFDGNRISETNRDLDNIIFVDTPWAIRPSDVIKTQLENDSQNGGAKSKNLHGLAIDAYYLAARTGLWDNNVAQTFSGRIGNVTLLPNGASVRAPFLAQFVGAQIRALE